MDAILSGESAGFELELLQCVREGKRKIQVVVRIIVKPAIQKVSHAGGLAACDGVALSAGLTLKAPAGSIELRELDGRARELDEVGGITAVEGEIENALVFHYGADAGGLGLDEGGIGFDRNLLVDGADLERN